MEAKTQTISQIIKNCVQAVSENQSPRDDLVRKACDLINQLGKATDTTNRYKRELFKALKTVDDKI